MRGLRPHLAVAILAPLLFVAGISILGNQIWIRGKAQVASVLIERAFAGHLESGGRCLPWSWADLYPIARLQFPRLGAERIILSGATGSSLAFGPGHIDGTALPNRSGNCAVAGHRDTWFGCLEDLRLDDPIVLTSYEGTLHYRVAAIEIVDRTETSILSNLGPDRLTLITCYPFGGLVGSAERFVAVAVREEAIAVRDRG